MKNKVNIKGVIVPSDESWIYELFGVDHTSTKTVSREIEKSDGGNLEVVINSGGGSVFDASEIYAELMNHPGNVEVNIVGIAASAASVIAMAGNKVKMAPTAQMMIHNAATRAKGDHNTMKKVSTMLEGTNKTIASAYQIKSGMEEEKLLELMDEETWMTPDDALKNNLIDEIMFVEGFKATASADMTNMIPQEVINGVRNGLLKDKQPSAGINEETLKQMFADFKEEITSELKQNNEPPKPEPTQNKMSKLFLNLK